MRLLDLVEEHDGERLAPHGLGELAAFFVTDIARRRADEPADGVLLHVLRHVELDERLFVAEQELGERLGQLGLPDTGRAEEDERPRRALGILEAGTSTADGLADGPDRILLADHPLVELVLHAQELGRLFLGELVHRDAGPDGKDLGDRLLVDLVEQVDALFLHLLLFGLAALEQFLLFVAQATGLFEALCFDGFLLLLHDLGDLVLELFEVRRRLHALDAQTRAGFVDEVDRLVGQVTVGDVPIGQVGRGDQRLVGDRDPVVRLVAIAQALEDLDRVRHRGLFDLDRLEATLEGGVLLEVLAVLVERGGTDGLQLAAGEHGLEDRGRVDGAFGGTRTHEGVELVDEQDDVAAGLDLLQHLLEALLEVAAVTAARDQCAQVERVELLGVQRLGHGVGRNGLRQALDDGGLADAGLADEHRVVLGSPAQHLHHALGLALAPDHGIELLLARELREVTTELVEHKGTRKGSAPRCRRPLRRPSPDCPGRCSPTAAG